MTLACIGTSGKLPEAFTAQILRVGVSEAPCFVASAGDEFALCCLSWRNLGGAEGKHICLVSMASVLPGKQQPLPFK